MRYVLKEKGAMWSEVQQAMDEMTRMVGRMDREHWIVVFIAAFLIGVLLMRGFGPQLR